MKKNLSKFLVAMLVLALSFSMAACGGGSGSGGGDEGEAAMIGVSMPTQSLQRWNQDGANMKEKLEAKGYTVELLYGDGAQANDIPTQVSQIENMITKGCSVLVIAAIDSASLTDVLAQAADAGIKVIAYDRLITETPNVDYYATFDNYKVGVIQGTYIKDKLDLDNAAGPFNMEVFGGDPGDTNAGYFYNGAMDTLKQYIDSGKLVIKSGQKDFNTVAINGWKSEGAQNRMENLLTAFYADGTKLDVVLSPNDSLAQGIAAALDTNGSFKVGENWPVLTGQDCDIPSVVNMIAGKQSMSVFKDTRTLAEKVVGMVDALISGSEPEINDTETYNNGVKVVPSYLCDPVYADIDNYKELLIDSGYYSEDQLK